MESDLVTSLYTLSIRFFPDGFSLFIFDEKLQLISQVHDEIIDMYHADIENILKNNDEIHGNYRHIKVYVESTVYTLIPTRFDNPFTNRSMLELQFPALEKNAEIISQKFLTQDFSLLWVIPENIRTAILSIFPDTSFQHHLTDLLIEQTDVNEEIIIGLRSKEVDFIIRRKKKILLCNSLNYYTAEDLIYHTLNFLKQLEIDIDQCSLKLIQEENGTHTFELLKKFLPQITELTKKTIYENYQREI